MSTSQLFLGTFAVTLGLAVYLFRVTQKHTLSAQTIRPVEFVRFQRNYLLVYLSALFADWLKGPYVYALYESYGFDQLSIAQLFIAGFLASLIAGTFVGGLSDKYGRKRMCLLFSILYFVSGATKGYNDYWILMFGRLTSGIATSLLFSAFESWMVCAHNYHGFSQELLQETFSKAQVGNGVVAVVAGLAAYMLAEVFGYVAPFYFALLPLALVGILVQLTWTENYGDATMSIVDTFQQAWNVIRHNPKVVFLGSAQSGFEGGMYTFVFMWTPALMTAENKDLLPYGVIFSVFMLATSIGGSVFNLLTQGRQLDELLVPVHVTACVTMLVPALMPEYRGLIYLSFIVFEVAVGVFYPTFGALRAGLIPETNRAAVTNLFRIPLNAFVVCLLLLIERLSVSTMFLICAMVHGLSLWAATHFRKAQDRGVSKLPLHA